MKIMNKMLVAATIFGVILQANAAKDETEPRFELFNRDDEAIYVSVKIGHVGRELDRQRVERNKRILLPEEHRPLNTEKKLTIYIYTGNKDQKEADYIYEIDAPGKNKYLVWQSKNLSPQKASGPLGLLYLSTKSSSGYSLECNVRGENIKKIRPQD